MSRKPRKKKKPRSSGRGASAATAVPEPTPPAVAEEDELIHAPRETSKLRFVLMIGLVVVLLIIFIVPGAIMSLAGRGAAGNPVLVTWQRPGHGEVAYTSRDLTLFLQDLDFAIEVDPLLAFQLGIFDNDPTWEAAARLLVIDQLALDAGVRLTPEDLAAHLRTLLDFRYQGSSQIYKQYAGSYPRGLEVVEDTIRRGLRAERFLQLAGFAAAVPDPTELERLWSTDHVEFAFDYASVAIDAYEEAARTEVPADEELQTWFDEQPSFDQDVLKSPERRRFQLARFLAGGDAPAGLLTVFPEEEGADPEERAQEYYNRVFHRRFVRESEESPEEEQPAAQAFLPFDEVREACLAEASVYFAMQRWLTDLQTRQNAGEEIDFLGEASGHGLEVQEPAEAVSRDELEGIEGLGDAALVTAVFQTAPDSFGYGVQALENGLVIVRVVERVERVLPPFEGIRDQVAELWVTPRAGELALEALAALRGEFEEFTPEVEEPEPGLPVPPQDLREHRRVGAEAFAAAASAAGFDLARRDYLDRSGPVSADPLEDDPAHRFLWSRRELYDLAEDEVTEPVLDTEGTTAYLVRQAGEREVPLDRMSPGQYAQYEERARAAAGQALARDFDLEFLTERYGFWMKPNERDADDGDETEDDDPGAEETS